MMHPPYQIFLCEYRRIKVEPDKWLTMSNLIIAICSKSWLPGMDLTDFCLFLPKSQRNDTRTYYFSRCKTGIYLETSDTFRGRACVKIVHLLGRPVKNLIGSFIKKIVASHQDGYFFPRFKHKQSIFRKNY